MGANISERLVGADHRVVGFDLDREAMRRVAGVGARGVESLDDLVESLPTPRVVVEEFTTWRWAFAVLALGPIVGIAAMLRLRRLPEAAKIAGGLG